MPLDLMLIGYIGLGILTAIFILSMDFWVKNPGEHPDYGYVVIFWPLSLCGTIRQWRQGAFR